MQPMCQLPLMEQVMRRQALVLFRGPNAASASPGDLEHTAIDYLGQYREAGNPISFSEP
jgi:hypothetical protein